MFYEIVVYFLGEICWILIFHNFIIYKQQDIFLRFSVQSQCLENTCDLFSPKMTHCVRCYITQENCELYKHFYVWGYISFASGVLSVLVKVLDSINTTLRAIWEKGFFFHASHS